MEGVYFCRIKIKEKEEKKKKMSNSALPLLGALIGAAVGRASYISSGR